MLVLTISQSFAWLGEVVLNDQHSPMVSTN